MTLGAAILCCLCSKVRHFFGVYLAFLVAVKVSILVFDELPMMTMTGSTKSLFVRLLTRTDRWPRNKEQNVKLEEIHVEFSRV